MPRAARCDERAAEAGRDRRRGRAAGQRPRTNTNIPLRPSATRPTLGREEQYGEAGREHGLRGARPATRQARESRRLREAGVAGHSHGWVGRRNMSAAPTRATRPTPSPDPATTTRRAARRIIRDGRRPLPLRNPMHACPSVLEPREQGRVPDTPAHARARGRTASCGRPPLPSAALAPPHRRSVGGRRARAARRRGGRPAAGVRRHDGADGRVALAEWGSRRVAMTAPAAAPTTRTIATLADLERRRRSPCGDAASRSNAGRTRRPRRRRR